jgi:hypothetical protein
MGGYIHKGQILMEDIHEDKYTRGDKYHVGHTQGEIYTGGRIRTGVAYMHGVTNTYGGHTQGQICKGVTHTHRGDTYAQG